MLLSSHLPLSALVELCRALRHNLGAGLSLPEVFHQQGRRGPRLARPVAGRLAELLDRGNSLEQALKRESASFPPLFVSLVSVGENTGMLPEIFGELERYYGRQQKLRNQFRAQVAWPILQLIAAIFIVAGLILVMGMLPRPDVGKGPYDPLGLGLSGPTGALVFLGVVGGVLGGLAGLYLGLRRVLGGGASADAFLLALPVVGPCLEALALARFCLALRLTYETGLPIARALRLALRATGNDAFIARTQRIEEAVRAGNDLSEALAGSRRFPPDFLDIMANAEEAGRLSDVLRHQADHYHEEAGRRLTALTRTMSAGIWLVVAGLIILVIFRIFGSYLKLLDSIGG